MLPYTLIGAIIFTACIFSFRVLNTQDKEFIYGALPAFVRRKLPFLKGGKCSVRSMYGI